MAHSSYQTLARYDDCAYRIHARSMNDIRQRAREALNSFRSQARQMQHCKIRRLHIASDEYEGEEEQADFYSGNDGAWPSVGYDQVDHQNTNPSSAIVSTSGWAYDEWTCQPHPSNAPSPSLSNDSDYCSNSVRSCDSPGLRKPPTIQRAMRPRTRREILCNRKRINNAHYNPELIKSEFQVLKIFILSHLDDSEQLRWNIRARWQVISNAVDSSDEQLSLEALLLLIQLIKDHAINTSDLLFIMQQGIYITLKNSLMRMGKQQLVAVELIYHIVNTDNRSAPYMIELMTSSQIFGALDELICTGTDEESQLVTELYVHLFHISKRYLSDAKFQPILPETLTGPNIKMSDHYNSIRSFQRLVRPEFMELLFNRFLMQLGTVEEPTVKLAMSLVSDCLEFSYAYSLSNNSDINWARQIAVVLKQSQLDKTILRACEGSALKRYKTFGASELKQFLHNYRQITSSLLSRQALI